MANVDPPITEVSMLQDLLRRMRLMLDEVQASRPDIAACDNGWTKTEECLDEAIASFGQAVTVALDHFDDVAAVEAGDRRWRPDGTTEPVPE